MASIKPEKLSEPIYLRLPVQVAEEVRRQASEQGRTLSLQLRWIIQKALLAQEQSEHMNKPPTNE